MINFRNDYSQGAYQKIIERLLATNHLHQPSYGEDFFSIEAKKLIHKHLNNPNAEIYFVSGGTQANLIVISSLLRPYESVISAETGHINVHEAGSIEAVGHKINSIATKDGKINPDQIIEVLENHSIVPHMVVPRLVYISNPTELGTIYTKKELLELNSLCREKNLILYMDGARLGNALTASSNDVSLADISQMTDVFYIGGTKNGALLGEAIVINNPLFQVNFAFNLKQKGALLAKSRLLGIQFLELFAENAYFQLAQKANILAQKIQKSLADMGFELLVISPTNQIFPILPNILISRLLENFEFYIWQKIDNSRSAIRIVTAFDTSENDVDLFISTVKNLRF